MKNIQKIIPLLLSIFLLTACATTQRTVAADGTAADRNERVVHVPNPISLADLVERAPGVRIDVRTGFPTVRGGYPLYIVDGVRMGTNFRYVNSALNVNDVKRVRVLRNIADTVIYGRDATNGVVLIETS